MSKKKNREKEIIKETIMTPEELLAALKVKKPDVVLVTSVYDGKRIIVREEKKV
jgi:hypothetical protein